MVQVTTNLRRERQISTPREMMPIHTVNGTAVCTNCSNSAAVKAVKTTIKTTSLSYSNASI